MRERVILLVDMDAFFASCEQAADPRLAGKPVIVCGNFKKRSVVAACSYEAKAHGVGNGMPVPEALALCPGAVLVAGNPDRYTRVARLIFEGLIRYTPLIEIVSIDEAFLDVTDTHPRFGSPQAIAVEIQRRVEMEFHLSCTVGIGPNKLLAKLAAKLNKPRGIGRIGREEVPDLLKNLPADKVNGIGPAITRTLLSMGIATLGELAQLPVSRLTSRFGFYGELLFRMARGIDESPVLPIDSPEVIKSMGHAYTLDQDTRDPAIVQGTLLKLSEKVGRRLRAAGLRGKTVWVVLRFSDFSAVSRQKTLGEGLCEGLAIYRAAGRLLAEIWSAGGRPVRLVGVGVSHLLAAPENVDLWEDRQRQRRLTASLDRINDCFGEETAFRAATLVPFTEKTRGYFGHRWF
ncbi:MAG: DNA polymerase IV [Candidatus Omnitrophica bacterium]|nr:DNA polymerase IV [Candidatus Omnitrophota bacterium]